MDTRKGEESTEKESGKDGMAVRTEVVAVVLLLVTTEVTVSVTSALINLYVFCI